MVSGIESKMVFSIPRSYGATAFAGVSAIALAVAEVGLDLGTWVELDIATIYGIPLVLAAFTRNRRLLWGLMVALTLATFITYTLQIPVGGFELRESLFVNRVLDTVALLLTGGLLHVWMVSRDIREAQAHLLQEQNRRLEVANGLLIGREAQIVLADDVTFLGVEALVFGRAAMGESVTSGSLRDRRSIGSMPSRWARSSMADSSANTPVVAPGPRM